MTAISHLLGKVHQGDCLEFMRQLPDKCVDLVLTDPPYGISADKGSIGYGHCDSKKYTDNWDDKTPDKTIFEEILRISKIAIIFGGNFFTDKLPVNAFWIVWDKTGGIQFDNPFSDCELAWTNINRKSVKKYVVIQQGFIAQEKERFHPTQKPVILFKNIIRDFLQDGVVFDPYIGSGTCGIAAESLGRKWFGCEISPEYCKISEKRIEAERAQLKLFT